MQTSDSPSGDLVAVTPHDTTPIKAAIEGRTQYTRSLFVGGDGDVEVISRAGQTVVFTAVGAGTLLPIQVSHVKDANTDATNIVALF